MRVQARLLAVRVRQRGGGGRSCCNGAAVSRTRRPDGKLAYLSGYMVNGWNQQVTYSGAQARRTSNAQEQASQFEQKTVGGAQGVIFNLSHGGSIRRFTQQAKQNQIYVANIWDSQPWFTPFDANEYWTGLLAVGPAP